MSTSSSARGRLPAALAELAYVVRRLWRTPAFSVVVIATLAVSLGALATVYAVVQAVVLDALPFAEPARLVRIENRPVGNPDVTYELSYPDFVAWQREAREVLGLAGYASVSEGMLVGDARSSLQRTPGGIVSWNLFAVLGCKPVLGRPLLPSDDHVGASPVIVISERLWRRRFAADPRLVGSVLQVEGTPTTVVGVIPAAFDYPVGAQLWLPASTAIPPSLLENSKIGFFNLIGRLAPGVSMAAAESALRGVQDRVSNATRPPEERQRVDLLPLADSLLADTRRPLFLLLGGTLVLLLLACANVANLHVVRAIHRREELAVRAALGGNRWRLAAYPLLESLVLGLVAAIAAVGLAELGIDTLVPLQPVAFFRASAVRLSPAVLLAVALGALLSALLFAVPPLWWTLRQRSTSTLRLGSRTHGGGPRVTRLLAAGVWLQIALTTVLLLGAGVLLRSFERLRSVDPGFATDHVLTFSLPLFGDTLGNVEATDRLFEDVVARAEALPGVVAAAGVLLRPLQGPDGYDARYTLDDRTASEAAHLPLVQLEKVTPHYFSAMRIPLLAGRLLTDVDREDSPRVIVVSRAVERRLWPGQSAVGKVLHWSASLKDGKPVTVVGVVGDGRYQSLGADSMNVYLPYKQHKWPMTYVVVRTSGDPEALLPSLRAALRGIGPDVQPIDVATTGELRDHALARPRFLALLLGVVAGLAMLVGALGLHGVLSYGVVLRRRELGIRLALGAERRHSVGAVLGAAARLAVLGTVSGLLAGWAACWSLRALLDAEIYGGGWADPLVFVGVPLLVAVLALIAAIVPALGAALLEPVEVLRA